MSLLLDLALFFRHSESKLNLTLSQRGVLFTLAARVGSNASTWLKQSSLAEELGIDERNVREGMQKISSTGIVLIEKQKTDGRKNIYRFHPALSNYAQLLEQERSEIHQMFGDSYCPVSIKSKKKPHVKTSKDFNVDKNTGRNHPVTSENTGRNHPVNTGRNHPVTFQQESSQTHALQWIQANHILPKEKEEREKERERERTLSPSAPSAAASFDQKQSKASAPPSKSLRDREFKTVEAVQICKDKNLDIEDELKRFENYYNGREVTGGKFLRWLSIAKPKYIARSAGNQKGAPVSDDPLEAIRMHHYGLEHVTKAIRLAYEQRKLNQPDLDYGMFESWVIEHYQIRQYVPDPRYSRMILPKQEDAEPLKSIIENRMHDIVA